MAERWKERRAFLLVWGGESVSVLGSRLTSFALSVWLYQRTGSVTLFGWAVVLMNLPGVLVAPPAGALVDRWGWRRIMVAANLGAGAATLAAAVLLFGSRLALWELGLILAANSVFDSFQQPAYLAALTQLVPRERLGRSGGMVQLSQAGARILAPALAGLLLKAVGVAAVLAVDGATFLVALLALALLPVAAAPAAAERGAAASMRREIAQGWGFLRAHRGLMRLLSLFTASGFLMSMLEVLMLPLVLTVASVAAAGAVASALGLGMLLGSLAMSAWGGPRRQLRGVLAFTALKGVALVVAGLRPDVVLVTIGFVLLAASLPMAGACEQVLWQQATPAELRGRVFSLRRLSAQLVAPLGMLAAGPLVDRYCAPWMAAHGLLAGSVGRLLGTGTGRGIGLLMVAIGIANLALVAAGAASPPLRQLDAEAAAGAGDVVGPGGQEGERAEGQGAAAATPVRGQESLAAPAPAGATDRL